MNTFGNNILEFLITDESGKSEITTIQSLTKALAYSERLWKHSEIRLDNQNDYIEDTNLGVLLKPTKVSGSSSSFLIAIHSQDQLNLEDFKTKLFQHISNKLGFSSIRITYDSVSEQISAEILPYIKIAENTVRRILVKSTITNLGIEGFEASFPKAIDKINRRKSITNEYSNDSKFDTFTFSFEDISQLIGSDTSLREELGDQWDILNQLREKALSNSPLTATDLKNAKTASSELIALVAGNEFKQIELPAQNNFVEPKTERVSIPEIVEPVVTKTGIAQPKIQQPEYIAPTLVEQAPVAVATHMQPTLVVEQPIVETIKEEVKSAPSHFNHEFVMISDEIFLEELKKVENEKPGQKINLKLFVAETLATKGYGTGPAYFASRNLSASGKITVSEVKIDGLWEKVVNSN